MEDLVLDVAAAGRQANRHGPGALAPRSVPSAVNVATRRSSENSLIGPLCPSPRTCRTFKTTATDQRAWRGAVKTREWRHGHLQRDVVLRQETRHRRHGEGWRRSAGLLLVHAAVVLLPRLDDRVRTIDQDLDEVELVHVGRGVSPACSTSCWRRRCAVPPRRRRRDLSRRETSRHRSRSEPATTSQLPSGPTASTDDVSRPSVRTRRPSIRIMDTVTPARAAPIRRSTSRLTDQAVVLGKAERQLRNFARSKHAPMSTSK